MTGVSDETPLSRTQHGAHSVPERDLQVVPIGDYPTQLVEEAPADGQLWMPWSPDRDPIWVGPLFGPDAACPRCVQARLRENAPLTSDPRSQQPPWDTTTTARDTQELFDSFASHWQWATENPDQAERFILTVSERGTFFHAVPRDASCPDCGDRQWRTRTLTTPPDLQDYQGTTRVLSPTATWENIAHLVSPMTGVVTFLYEYQDDIIHGCGVSHAFTSRQPGNTDRLPVRTGGKGRSALAAKVAGVCEAVERTALIDIGDLPTRRASIQQMAASADIVDPRRVMLFAEWQYDQGRGVEPHPESSDATIRHRIPLPLGDETPLDWVPCWDLDGQPAWIPAAIVWFFHSSSAGSPTDDQDYCVADSNGVAVGTNATEAILHGLYEVIERDAVGIWWNNRCRRPAIHFPDSDYRAAVRRYLERNNRTLWFLDITTDIGVPVVVAVSAKQDGSEVIFGFGCHLDRQQAMDTATAECAQFLAGFHARPADPFGTFGQPGRDWWTDHTLTTDPYLAAHGSTSPVDDLSTSGSLRTDILTIRDAFQRVGLCAYTINMSRPDVPELAVYRVVVPHARSMFPRFAPGRLTDVPQTLRWTQQSGFNPVAIFF